MSQGSPEFPRLFSWLTGAVGTGLAQLISIVATLINMFCGFVLFCLTLVFMHEQVVPVLPFLPLSWHAGVSIALAAFATAIEMMVLEVVLILALAGAAVLVIEGCLIVVRIAKSACRRIQG